MLSKSRIQENRHHSARTGPFSIQDIAIAPLGYNYQERGASNDTKGRIDVCIELEDLSTAVGTMHVPDLQSGGQLAP